MRSLGKQTIVAAALAWIAARVLRRLVGVALLIDGVAGAACSRRRVREFRMTSGAPAVVVGRWITSLPAATRTRYEPAIAVIADAITLHRLPERPASTGRNLSIALCACPRRIRVARGVLRAGQITCEICQQPSHARPGWGRSGRGDVALAHGHRRELMARAPGARGPADRHAPGRG